MPATTHGQGSCTEDTGKAQDTRLRYDVHGRACAIDQEPTSRAPFVLEEDEGLVRIDMPTATHR